MVSWSTETVNERERFSYWREVVCQALFNVSAEAPHGNFTGHMQLRISGPLRFLTSKSSSYQFLRSERNISSAAADHVTILMQVRGSTAIAHRDDEFLVEHNDVAIFDGRQPFSANNSEGARRVVAVVPRAMIDSRAPWLLQRPLQRLAANSRFLDLTRHHLMQLASDNLSDSETSLLTDNLCNLLALASATDIPPNRLEPELQLEALLAFCRQNLHDPRLSPRFLADHFGISVRTLHLRFEMIGQTFGRWLLENRLDASGKALKNPRQQARTISEIAYGCGFNDLSHFNKSFRARFGMAPGELRSAYLKQQ